MSVVWCVMAIGSLAVQSPPAAQPRPGVESQQPSRAPAQDSAARADAMRREQQRVDSVRRQMQRRTDSLRRAAAAAAAAGPQPPPDPSRGEPPFFGYTWVFYADLLLGMVVGLWGLRIRVRRSGHEPGRGWNIAGTLLGLVMGAGTFIAAFMLTPLLLLFNLPRARTLFLFTAGVIVFLGLSVAFAGQRGRRRSAADVILGR